MSPAEAGATRRAGTGPQQQSDSRRVNEMGENKSKPLEQESQTVSGCAPAQSQAGVTPESSDSKALPNRTRLLSFARHRRHGVGRTIA